MEKIEKFLNKLNKLEKLIICHFINEKLNLEVYINEKNFKFINAEFLANKLSSKKLTGIFKKSLTKKGVEVFNNVVKKSKEILIDEVVLNSI